MQAKLSVIVMVAAGVAMAQAKPPLRGQEAVTALKQQGAYESLRTAYQAARYQVESAGRVGWYRAWIRAQGLEVEVAPDGVRLKHREGALGDDSLKGSAYVFTRPTGGDFDGNGKPDVIRQNDSTRQGAV
jgi:hypothetical protein